MPGHVKYSSVDFFSHVGDDAAGGGFSVDIPHGERLPEVAEHETEGTHRTRRDEDRALSYHKQEHSVRNHRSTAMVQSSGKNSIIDENMS